MAKTLSEAIDELKKSIEQIDFSENNIGKTLIIKDAYEKLAKIRFELIRDFEEIQEIFPADIELNRINAFLNNGIIVLEFDEALPCQKIDDVYISRVHWRSMMNDALKKLFAKYKTLPYFRTAFVCVEVHKTSKNWDISNRMINLVINMLKGNFMPDDAIENLVICFKGKQDSCEKTIIYIGDYHTQKEKILVLWTNREK